MIKKMRDEAFALEEELANLKKRLAEALGSKYIVLIPGGQIAIEYIPENATKTTVKSVDGTRCFDCYEAEMHGINVVHYSGYREVENES